jgi:ketosteroid isomerase-like protein
MKTTYLSILGRALAPLAMSAPAVAAAPTVTVVERGDAATHAAVLAAIEAYKVAEVKGDRAGLEKVYHDDLSYGHSDGNVLTKKQQIDRTLIPGRVFTEVKTEGLAIRSYGNIAYVTATWLFASKKTDGVDPGHTTRLSALDVWTKTRIGWQLIARQLTRPSE